MTNGKPKPLYFEEIPIRFPFRNCHGKLDDHMFLHSRCHVTDPVTARSYEDGFVKVDCGTCGKVIVGMLIEKPEDAIHKPRCHPQAGTWVSLHQKGFIRVACAECRALVKEIAIKRKPKDLHIVKED